MSEKQGTILAINDNPASLLALGAALAPEYELQIVPSGPAGFDLALACAPDLVLLEVGVPEMKGMETCRLFRLDPRLAAIPVIFITTLTDAVDELSLLELGAADYITQPFQIELVRVRIRNVLQLKRMAQALKASEERLHVLMEAAREGLWDWQIDTGIVTHNPSWSRLLGLDAALTEHPRTDFLLRIHPQDRPAYEQAIDTCVAGSGSYQCEYRLRHSDGHHLWVEERGRVINRSADGRVLRMVGSLQGIDERKRTEADLFRLSYFDLLTGLPNRRLLLDRLQQATIRNERSKRHGALLLIDLDRFRTFNASHGHALGDALLIETGSRLQDCVRERDTVARVGGDEFVVVLENLSADAELAARDAAMVGEKILAALARPGRLGPVTISCTTSIGLTLFGAAADDGEQVLKRAERAIVDARTASGNTLRSVLPASGTLSSSATD